MATQLEPRRTAADILGGTAQARGNGKSQATVVEQSRAIAEVQGALVVAANRPRDKAAALNEALESCRTREVAEGAFFKFSRGGGTVAGETIHLARELARCWGNIVYDVMELERNDEEGHSEMMARAWDLETNAQARLQFIVPHLRDKKGGPSRLTDVRDIYENNANMGARRLRECIFAVLPPYLVKAAADECRHTLERGESEEPIAVRVSKLLTAFAGIGIDKARIEAKLGPVDRFTPVDLANIRIAFQSIRRGEIMAEEEFPRIDGAQPQTSRLDALESAVSHQPPAGGSEVTAAADPSNDETDAGAVSQEGRGDADYGDQRDGFLDAALAKIEAATMFAQLDEIVKEYDALLDDEEMSELRQRRDERHAEMREGR